MLSLAAQARCAQAPPQHAADPQAAMIERAQKASEAFTGKMSNFVCQQVTNRYLSVTSGRTWNQVDVIAADLVLEDGKESYRNIAVNGEPASMPMEELGGTWSTGEFATMLAHLFSKDVAARFAYQSDAVQSGRPAAVFEYEVDQPVSKWEIAVNGLTINTAYRGKVWIDKESARVLRVEMQAARLPGRFPLSKVETTLDYEFLVLGGERFLLPVKAETLSCERFSPSCTRNAIEFRNYHRFTGQSKITFDKP